VSGTKRTRKGKWRGKSRGGGERTGEKMGKGKLVMERGG